MVATRAIAAPTPIPFPGARRPLRCRSKSIRARLFERLFGDGDSTDPAARLARLEEQRSILDYVAGSIDRLETKLGPRDRNKLNEYLEAIRDIERRIQKAEQQNASLKLPGDGASERACRTRSKTMPS